MKLLKSVELNNLAYIIEEAANDKESTLYESFRASTGPTQHDVLSKSDPTSLCPRIYIFISE